MYLCQYVYLYFQMYVCIYGCTYYTSIARNIISILAHNIDTKNY